MGYSISSNSITVRIPDEVSQSNVSRIQKACYNGCQRHAKNIGRAVLLLFLTGYSIYLGFSIAHNFFSAIPLIVITTIVVFFVIYNLVKKYFGQYIWSRCLKPSIQHVDRQWYWLQWVLVVFLLLGIFMYLIFFVVKEIRQLQSLSGFVIFLFIPWVTSKHSDKIYWRPVIWGVSLQFLLGILVLRWNPGFQAINFVAKEINKFLFYSLEGAAGVLGDPFFILHPLAFVVCPLVIYLGAVMAVLYYLGITQIIAAKAAWLMQISLRISAIESVSLTANIFLSVMDTMLLLRPYIPKLTRSEFHTFLVGSHATIAGFAFGLFVAFGVSPQHLLTGAVMSAPAAVAIAKLNWPETEQSRLFNPDDVRMEKGPEVNVIEAASNGAMVAGRGVASIMLQIVAFVSIYVFLNATVTWLGSRVGLQLNLEIILSYIFMPFSFLMGVEWSETRKVSSLLGVKVVFNEVLAFLDLGDQVRLNNLSDRSATIATYAMCGFSSVGTLAIFVGVWETIDPKRVKQVADQLPRVLLNSNISCFMTACIAGLFYNEDIARTVPATGSNVLSEILNLIPSYQDIFKLIPSV